MSAPILYREIETPSGTLHVRVNRRGCAGEWSADDDAALAALVRALSVLTPEQIDGIRDRAPKL